MTTIERYYPDWRELTIHESSPTKRGTSLKLKRNCIGYLETQYFPGIPAGSINFAQKLSIRNENLEAQTFPDEFFDIVITQDVMEHVYNPDKAFSEIGRTLKAGGAHIFTVPLVNKHRSTVVWATQHKDGNPVFLHSPEWHSNPVSQHGSPVTMHWGFDIVNYIRDWSCMETTIEHLDDLDRGIRAEYIEVLVSRKQG